LKFNRVLHERVVLLSVVTREQPRVLPGKRLHLSQLGEGIVRLVADVGFLQKPNIVQILREAASLGIAYDPEDTTFFISREELIAGQRSDLSPLRRRAFIQMSRNAQVATEYFGVPSGRVVEIGTRVEV
ncbi:MAG: potassium transporter Kup, partial [Proteobacteria bacterium]|nr:potassium transporter Kup [Pseudomonadota bacterium]